MSSFKKMILVPFEKKDNPNISRRSELDEQMAKILKRDDIDATEKFRMYQRLLEFYLRISKETSEDKSNNKESIDNESISGNSNSNSNTSISSYDSRNHSTSNNITQSYYDDYEDDTEMTKTYNKHNHLAHVNKYYKTTIDDSIMQSNKKNDNPLPKRVQTLRFESDQKQSRLNTPQQYEYNEPSPVKPLELQRLSILSRGALNDELDSIDLHLSIAFRQVLFISEYFF